MAEGDPAKALSEYLAEMGVERLRELVREPRIRSALLRGLAAVGIRLPSGLLLLYGLDKVLLGSSSFLGAAAASRLDELFRRVPPIRAVFEKLAAINRQERDRDKLRELLLAQLEVLPAGHQPFDADEATSLDVLTPLYQFRKLEGLSVEFRELFEGLQIAVRSRLEEIDAQHYEPQLGWSRQFGPIEHRSLSETLRYNSEQYEFVGRTAEMDFLTRFLGDLTAIGPLARLSWFVMTGAGGEGKSRLAMEFSRYAEAALGWKAGRIDMRSLERFDALRWRPRMPTCMMIDYAAQAPRVIGDMLASLQQNCADFDWPVRVLLLERDTRGEWYKELLPPTSTGAAIRQHIFRDKGKRLDEGWLLPAMHFRAVVEVMRKRFQSAAAAPPPDDLLLKAACRVDPRSAEIDAKTVPYPRPLFAMAAVEVLLVERRAGDVNDVALIDAMDREQVLSTLIERDRATRWKVIARHGEGAKLALHENLLALATMCLGVPRSALHALPQHTKAYLPEFSPKGFVPLDDALLEAMSGGGAEYIAGLEPDILGEFYVLTHLAAKREGAQALSDGAFAIGADNVKVFAMRCLRDFPERLSRLGLLAPSARSSTEAAGNFSRLSVDMSAALGRARDWGNLDQLLTNLEGLVGSTSTHGFGAVAAEFAMVLFNMANAAAQAGAWDRVDALWARLQALHTLFPADAAIAENVAAAAANMLHDAARTDDWARVESLLKFFDLLLARRAYGQDRRFVLIAMRAARNALANDKEWGAEREDMILRGIEAWCPDELFAQDFEVNLDRLHVLVRVFSNAARKGHWARVDRLYAALDSLGTPEIFRGNDELVSYVANIFAETAFDAANAVVWGQVTAAWRRFDSVATSESCRLDAATAVRAAKIARHIAAKAGIENQYPIMLMMLDALEALRRIYILEEEPRQPLKEAHTISRVLLKSAEAGDWLRVNAMLARLGALKRHQLATNEPRLGTSLGAAAVAVITYAARQEWERIEALGQKADAALPPLANDAPLVVAAFESTLLGYCSCRKRGDAPDIDTSTQAAIAAFMILRLSLAHHAHPLQREPALQTIKDCHARFPEGIECGRIYRHCVDRGIDFGGVQDLI